MSVVNRATKIFSITYIYSIANRYFKYYMKIFRSYFSFNTISNLVHGKIKIVNKKNVKIGSGCSINEGVVIQGDYKIVIGNNVVLSTGVMILDAGLDFSILTNKCRRVHIGKKTVIGNNNWIAAGAIILPGVTLGDNVLVGAGSVVTKSFGSNCIIAGNPAKLIQKLNHYTDDK